MDLVDMYDSSFREGKPLEAETQDMVRKSVANNLKHPYVPGFVVKISETLHSWLDDAAQDEVQRQNMLKNVMQTNDALSRVDTLKLLIGILLFVPRVIMFTIVLIVGFLLVNLLSLGTDPSKPLSETIIKVQNWINFIGNYLTLLIWGIVISVKGKPCSLTESLVQIGSPHSTFWDGFVIGFSNRGEITSYVGKASVAPNKLMLRLFSWQQNIFVDRENKESKNSAGSQLIRRGTSPEWKRKITIFPEGTCANKTALLRFNAGAFRIGVPVQPILIKWNGEIAWAAGSKSRSFLVLRSMCELYHACEVEFLPVYQPSQEEIEHPTLFAQNVRKVCAEELQLPVCNGTFIDRSISKLVAKKGFELSKVLDFYFEDVYNFVKGDELIKSKKSIGYDEKELYQVVRNDFKMLLRLFIKYANKKDSELDELSYEKLQAVEDEVDKKFLVKTVGLDEAVKFTETTGAIEWESLSMGAPSINFRILVNAFCIQKYKS